MSFQRTPSITLFLSPGRSGTQWLRKILRERYRDLADITHEPIEYHYRPALTLRQNQFEETINQSPELKKHLEYIDGVLNSGKHYIETGWPIFSWIPYFYEKYPNHLKLVQLTRHPVYFACSQATHDYYQPRVRVDGFTRYAQLDPFDKGVLHKEYQQGWEDMSVDEKCLFQWLEIHEYAYELEQQYPRVPFLRIRMEDLFNPKHGALNDLLHFLELPPDRLNEDLRNSVVDGHPRRTIAELHPDNIRRHPHVIRLAAQMGYDALKYDAARMERYKARSYRWFLKTLWSYVPKAPARKGV
jgi:hypothetical protein